MVTETRKPAAMPLQFGSVGFKGWSIPLQLQRQIVSGIRTGPEVTREGREGVFTFAIDDLSGGFSPVSGIASAARDKNLVYSNEGLMHHLPKLLCLPYASTAQTAVVALDISGARAANKRVHSAMYQGRFYAIIDTQLFKDTSTSNPALVTPATADGIADKCTAMAIGKIAGVQVLAEAGAATDDIQYTTDPANATVPWTKMVTLSDTPYINYLAYLNIGPGVWVFTGRPSTALGTGVWHFKQDATLPATPQPVVLTATKDIPGTLASTTHAAVDLTFIGQESTSGAPWDSSAGTQTVAASADVDTGYVWFGAGDFAAVPRGNQIIGIQLVIAATVENASLNVVYKDMICKAGGGTSISFAPGGLLDTSGTDSAGGTAITGGLNITGADLDEFAVGVSFIGRNASGSTAYDLSITDVDATITSRPFGTMPVPTLGGSAIPPLRWSPARIANLEREADELTAVTLNQRLRYDDYEWDSDSDRATVTWVYPPTNMAHIEDIEDFQGGVACAGAPSSGVGQSMILMDSQNIARDLGFPGVNGATAVRITSMFSRKTALFYWVQNSDSTDAQLWMYANGKHFAFGALFSKTLGAAMTTAPLAWAEKTMGLTQNQIYNFYPSSTNVAAVRQFVPFDPFSDPFLTNTSEVKQDGPLAIQTLELDVLPPEANKAVMAINCQSRRIDNDTTYGSARIYVDTGGDHTFAAAEIDQTFDAAAETFTDRNLATSNDPGVAYRTMITRIALNHQTGTAETPNPLPFLFLIAASWPLLERWMVVMAKEGQMSDFITMMKRLKTLTDTKVAQRFTGGGYNDPAIIEDFKVEYNSTMGTEPPSWADVKSAVLTIRKTVGGLS